MRALTATAAAILTLIGGLCLSGCSSTRTAPPLNIVRMDSPTGQGELLIQPPTPATGLVLFTHGYGGRAAQVLEPGLMPLDRALIGAGFAIASSDSHGNNLGDPASVQDQVQLLHDAEARLPGVRRVDLVGFSMGGLDALLAASEHVLPGLEALVLVSPVCNQVPFLQTSLGPAIRAVYGPAKGQQLLAALTPSDPERRSPASYAGYRYWFWHSAADRTVPPVQSASMVAILQSVGASVRFSPLSGGHGDFSKLQPEAVTRFFLGDS